MEIYFEIQRKKVSSFLKDFFSDQMNEVAIINQWGEDVCKRLLEFTTQGKMIRGSMVIFSYELFKKKINEDIVSIASAIEILHSALLIHDDIMDSSDLRRSHSTISKQYNTMFNNNKVFGNNMAICAGDISFFLGMSLLNSNHSSQSSYVINKVTKEFISVGIGQMQDVYFGLNVKKPTEEEILNLYRYKTGRYTFSLPFMIGGMLGGASEEVILQLESIGETIGILFQLKDDEIGLFGDEKKVGKPIGSDIKENKKTLYWLYLFKSATEKEKQKILNVFGNQRSTISDLKYVYNLLAKYKIQAKVNNVMDAFDKNLQHQIKLLNISSENKLKLKNLVKFNMKRGK